ncbi:MAG: ECF transporter S component [Gemmiger sp.]|uniref:ECF transporter S component n=1 Tax=Gemmiger sp. TaxID=2049027 RepID=UPI002E7A5DB7|nr:ECF transporter S component [Gemmiger sp.]MEE0710239.1 ECF transporter S component [Gemmiger sp.]
MTNTHTRIRELTVTAMLCAVATILMFLDFSLPMVIPSFVKMDVSELPALLASFSLGPVYGIAVCLVKNILNVIFHGSTGGIGELCNFLIGASFVGTAGLIYRSHKTRKGAVIAALVGAVVMAVVSVPVNYFLSYPVYAAMFGGIDAIIAAYQELRPGTNGLMECLLVFNMPFTLVKGLLNAAICFLIYKPLSPILHGRH